MISNLNLKSNQTEILTEDALPNAMQIIQSLVEFIYQNLNLYKYKHISEKNKIINEREKIL